MKTITDATDKIAELKSAVDAIPAPVAPTDFQPVIDALQGVIDSIKAKFPAPTPAPATGP